ncbi:MAG: NAD(P)H-dependent oxidoreductase, partial [Nitrospinota bacterium]
MASGPKILAFTGSAWKDPINKKLVKFAAQGARGVGAQVTELDFADLPLPLFDQDVDAEEGLPAGVIRLKELMRENDGFLIASPEYNSSISPMLKNAIDWASR